MYGIYHTYTLYIELLICFSFSYSIAGNPCLGCLEGNVYARIFF